MLKLKIVPFKVRLFLAFIVQLSNAPRLPAVGEGGMGVSGDKYINYKLRLFTPRSSYGAKEMAPKSQLCACSFQDSLRQKNWALEQIRKFLDTIGYVCTAENDSNTLRVDAKIFASSKNICRKEIFGYVWTWPKTVKQCTQPTNGKKHK